MYCGGRWHGLRCPVDPAADPVARLDVSILQSKLLSPVLGIDEHTLHRQQRFATTFCDLKNPRVFDISPGRSEAELAAYLRTLRGRERVRVVGIDHEGPAGS